MAKKKQINGTIYTPHKNCPKGVVCNACRKLIQSCIAYTSDNSSNNFYCPHCVSVMWNKYVNYRIKNAQQFPLEQVIYVGKMNHKCSNTPITYTDKMFWFGNDKNDKIRIVVYQCNCCGEYIMRRETYDKHRTMLEECYKVYNSKTNKPFSRLTLPENYQPHIVAKAQVRKIPHHIQWAITHPYQGGGCSGK